MTHSEKQPNARIVRKLLPVVLTLLVGCVTDPSPPESDSVACERICAKTAQCPGLTGGSDCKASCEASHYPTGCADALEAAKCTEISAGVEGGGSWVPSCYPKCTPDGQICQGDVVMVCSNGHYSQADCSYRCESVGDTYSGVCAATRNGQTTPNGLPDCWCD